MPKIGEKAYRPVRSGGNHSAFSREIEEPAGIHHRAHVAKGLEFEDLPTGFNRDRLGIQINRHHVTRFQEVAKTFGQFARVEFAGGDAIPEENARKTFGQYD